MAYKKIGFRENDSPFLDGQNMAYMDDWIYNNSQLSSDNRDRIIALEQGEKPQGGWTPKPSAEYPPDPEDGQSWFVTGLTVSGYIFADGDLKGKQTYNGDKMFYNNGWHLITGSLNPGDVYMLDGSQNITAPFAGGGQRFTSAADAVLESDLATLRQLNEFINIGTIGARRRKNG